MTRRRVLALAPYPPRFDGLHGGSRALAELIRALGERYEIVLLACRAPGEPPIDSGVAAWCERSAETPRTGQPAGPAGRAVRRAMLGARLLGRTPSLVARWHLPRARADLQALVRGWTPDIVQVHGEVLAGLARGVSSAVPRVLVSFEPPVRAAADAARGAAGARSRAGASLLSQLELRAWRAHTAAALARFDAVVTLTDADRDALAGFGGAAERVTIPLGLTMDAHEAHGGDDAGAPLLLFVGNFVHPPNREAALRLVRTIFPALHRERPTLRLRIVGDAPPPELVAAAGDGVEITGRVPDVRPHLAAATVVVAPISTGGGIRVKVLEALAAGAAVVATTRALEGIGAADGRELLAADDDAAFVHAVGSLLDDPERRRRMGAAAREWAARTLGWDEPVTAYGRLYDTLLEHKPS